MYLSLSLVLMICDMALGNPLIEPSPVLTVTEGRNATMKCTYQLGNSYVLLNIWNSINPENIYASYHTNCDVLALPPLPTSCIESEGKRILNITLTTDFLPHGVNWFCGVSNTIVIVNTTIYVEVPVTYATLTQLTNDMMIENSPIKFKCVSKGRPAPVIGWYKQTVNGTDIKIETGVRSKTGSDDTEIESILVFDLTRDDNGNRIYCLASNTLSDDAIVSQYKPLLNVIYMPDRPPTISNIINGSNYAVIESTLQTSTCTITGGNPLANLYWDCFGETGQQSNTSDTVSSTITWSGQRGVNGQCKCRSQHIAANATVGFMVEVLYHPTSPIIKYKQDNGIDIIVQDITMIQGQKATFTCYSNSNPAARYSWSTGQSNLTAEVVVHQALTEIACTATNQMKPSNSGQQTGTNSSTIGVTILYPPEVQYLANLTLEEGNILNVTCAVSKGNPHSNTMFRWSDTLSVISSTAVLRIHNITRNHSGMYTCLVYNTLKPTFGRIENGSDIESFNLDVFYKTSIIQFYTERDGLIYTNVTINETNALNIMCSVDSNPTSNLDIRRNGLHIATETNVKRINHLVNSTACDDAGIYTCTGYNPYIQDQSRDTADIMVFVRCYPRATKQLKNITTAAQDNTVHFNATFMAYPVPREDGYIWRKQYHNISWLVLESNDRINISTGYLKTSLTIQKIRQSDYGNYSLTVSNNVGQEYRQIFELIPHDTPGKPEKVQVMILENNEVVCSWRHGFNGGYKQTFVIQLRTDKISWYNITFELRRNVTSQLCWTILNDFNFDKTYYIRIYSYNILGRSDSVTDPELKFVIKSEPMEQTMPDSTVGVIVGIVVSAIVVIIIAAVAVLLYRRNSHADKDTGLAIEPKSTLKAWVCCCQAPSKSYPRPNIYVNVALNDHTDASVSESLSTENKFTPVGSKKPNTVSNRSGGSQLTEATVTPADPLKRGIVSYSSDSQLTKTPVTPTVSGIKGSAANNNGSRLTETPETHKKTTKRETIEMEALEHAYCNVFKDKSFGVADLRTLSMSVRQHPKKLDEQFKGLKNGKRFSAKAAEKLTNKSKNRYKEMHPYDKNRIVLPVIKCNPDSDYINASSIKGYGENGRNYIASQAALENTLADFWRMIWTQNVTQIVMLTNCTEHGRLKCYKYWPDDNSKVYGNITVRIVTEDVYSEYTIRVFDVRLEGGSKTVTQYHFTAWPDKDVPDTCVSLVQLWKMVKEGTKDTTSPLMVHCSAGVGRTGTFLALDYLYDQGQAEGFVNFYECVVKLREQRMTMVQTVDQYAFLHHAVLEALDPIVEVCKTETFKDLRQRLLKPEDGSGSTQLKTEYRMLEAECLVEIIQTVGNVNKGVATNPKRDEFGDSKIQQNKDKSRCQDILPSDLYRPVLEMVVPDGGDYINAVVLSTYRFIDRMIITQVPLSNTVIDFLRMVWDFDVSTIILMEKDIPKTDMYWPASGKRSFGIFEAEVVVGKETVGKSFIKRTIRYTVNGTNGQVEKKDVLILQFTVWPEDNLPDPKSMTSLIAELERKHVMTDPDAPFVVQCLDGASKSGLFCVLWSVLERMKFEREVAISETVRFLRTRRKQIIRNYDQYQYCYDLVQQYLDEFEVYNNVV